MTGWVRGTTPLCTSRLWVARAESVELAGERLRVIGPDVPLLADEERRRSARTARVGTRDILADAFGEPLVAEVAGEALYVEAQLVGVAEKVFSSSSSCLLNSLSCISQKRPWESAASAAMAASSALPCTSVRGRCLTT